MPTNLHTLTSCALKADILQTYWFKLVSCLITVNKSPVPQQSRQWTGVTGLL